MRLSLVNLISFIFFVCNLKLYVFGFHLTSLRPTFRLVRLRSWIEKIRLEVTEIGDRLDEAVQSRQFVPFSEGVDDVLNIIDYEALKKELILSSTPGNAVSAFLRSLSRSHFAVLRLSSNDSEVIRKLWKASQDFYELPTTNDRIEAAGPLREIIQGFPIGFASFDENEFLETRLLGPNRQLLPVFNEDVGKSKTCIESSIINGRKCLTNIGRVAVSAVSSTFPHIPWLELLDDGENLGVEEISSSVLRLCSYRNQAPVMTVPLDQQTVAFGAHTDSTFFTIVPVASTPGLQIFNKDVGWISPEEFCNHDTDVVLMPGEFLQVLSSRTFPCCVHRVLKPHQGGFVRYSTPLLLRGRGGYSLSFLSSEKEKIDSTISDLHGLLLSLMKEDNEKR
jgi:hypothetical protein